VADAIIAGHILDNLLKLFYFSLSYTVQSTIFIVIS